MIEFSGKVGEFCKYAELFLTEDIKSLLNYQFDRLSPAEQEVMRWLASENKPVTICRSIESLNMFPADVRNAIISLGRRGLVKQVDTNDGNFFSLQSIVKQFISAL